MKEIGAPTWCLDPCSNQEGVATQQSNRVLVDGNGGVKQSNRVLVDRDGRGKYGGAPTWCLGPSTEPPIKIQQSNGVFLVNVDEEGRRGVHQLGVLALVPIGKE